MKTISSNNDWMRAGEAASYLRISRRCLSDWQARRLIPHVKAGRKVVLFKRDDLDRAMSKLSISAVGK